MLYSRYAKKNPAAVKLQEAQRKEIEKAREAKRKADSHVEKLQIEARTRSKLNDQLKEKEKSEKKEPAVKQDQRPVDKKPELVDLKNKKQVEKAIKKIVKEIK